MVYFVLPIYNEEDNLGSLIGEIRKIMPQGAFRIIAVNDGSTDGTLPLLESLKGNDLTITGSIINMNVGAVFSTGIEAVLKEAKPDDVLFILEGDQTSELNLVLPMQEQIQKGQDIVIASRYLKGGGYVNFPFSRKIFSLAANHLMRSFFPVKDVLDYTIFFRAYRVGVIRKAAEHFGIFGLIQSKGFVANAELLVKLHFFTDRITEVPFIYNYGKKKGKSKIKVMNTINEYFVVISYLKRIQAKMARYKGERQNG
jgi:dolichol-phosphate mannosyltransferase